MDEEEMQRRAVETYTRIHRKFEKTHRFTIHPPAIMKELLIFYLDGGFPADLAVPDGWVDPRVPKFVDEIYKKMKPRGVKFGVFRISFPRVTHLFDAGALADDGDLDRGYAYIVALSLGFHVVADFHNNSLHVLTPARTSMKYFQALYIDAMLTYKQLMMERAAEMGLGGTLDELRERTNPSVHVFPTASGRRDVSHVSYAQAISTSLSYEAGGLDPARFPDGFFKHVPKWFAIVQRSFETAKPASEALRTTDAPLPLSSRDIVEEAVAEAVEVGLSAGQVQIDAVKDEYERRLADLQVRLQQVDEANRGLQKDVGDAKRELGDVSQNLADCLSREETANATDIGTAVENIRDVRAELGQMATKTATISNRIGKAEAIVKGAPVAVDRARTRAVNDLLLSIRTGTKLKHVEREKPGPDADDPASLHNMLLLAMKKRRGVVGQRMPPARSGRSSPRLKERRKNVISPTRAAFGDVFDSM